ncbi:hypothetical protein DENIS_1594 [Desulfonema ishimotonii]|uniref:LysM domain-containing protein n=2 Tax=Desulfonema ishimotonii TaxID=45657 RepID=A0A401FUH0_9BACT|nr:hypothetical protein DENIS_1594 [Desulfonema ishimotonii]
MAMKTKKDITMPIILAGAAGITILICIGLFYPKGDSSAEKEAFEARILRLEERIDMLESKERENNSRFSASEEAIGSFSTQAERLQAIPIEIESIQKKIEYLDKRQGNLEQKIAKSARKPRPSAQKSVKSAKTGKKSPSVSKPAAGAASSYYYVKSGDTLYSIARRYSLTVEQLLRLNNMSEDAVLHLNQKLRVSR